MIKNVLERIEALTAKNRTQAGLVSVVTFMVDRSRHHIGLTHLEKQIRVEIAGGSGRDRELVLCDVSRQ